MSRRFPAPALLALALMLPACERGCLAAWVTKHTADPGPDLFGTDCSDGLARCVGGRVQASRAAHLPATCPGCECPWEPVASCRAGCAEQGLEVVATADVAAIQLCRPEVPLARPVLPSDPGITELCAEDGLSCVASVLRMCDGASKPVRPLAVCLHGCAGPIRVAPSDVPTVDGAIAILCRRDQAERR